MKSVAHALLFVAILIALPELDGGNTARAEKHRHQAWNRCCIPKHNYGHDTPRFSATEFAVANAVVNSESGPIKPFHFRAIALTVDHLRLDRVGLEIHKDSGEMVATGRITHSGGDGGLIGSNVTVRIRALVAASADTAQIPPDAVVVWQAERHVWIPRGQHWISLMPANECFTQSPQLLQSFDRITHLEVELEYQRDR